MNDKERMRRLMDELAGEMGEPSSYKGHGGKMISEIAPNGKQKLMEDELSEAGQDPVLAALVNAYTFITQPQKMQTRGKNPTILTYHTSRYNELTAELRAAIQMRKGE